MTDCQFEEIFRAHAGMAYGLALGVTGDPAAAEDAVQEAFMYLWRRGAGDRAEDVRAYLASSVISAARGVRRGEVRRRKRETAVSATKEIASSSGSAGTAESAETHQAVRTALLGLEEKRRLPVMLHVVQDFSQREVARILSLPVSTVSHRINEGLTELRSNLGRAGFASLDVAALAIMLKAGWSIPVPAGLAEAVKSAVVLQSPVSGHGPAASATLKGGVIMKVGLGIAAVGLVAGSVLMAAGGRSEEPAKPVSQFSTPATDPGAEWENKGIWAGIGIIGYLDGPRLEAMSGTSPRPGIFTEDGGENIFRTYDPKTDRFMTIGGCGSAGELDGPLSRARFGGWGYAVFGTMAGNSEYFFMITRSKGTSSLRRFDFKKRVVEPFAPDVQVGNATKICAFEGGIFLQTRDNLKKVSNDGKLLADMKIGGPPDATGAFYGESLGPYDPKNDRMYGSSREGQGGWVVWRWDLKDGGKFVGILPAAKAPGNQPLRSKCATGPFKGSLFYCPGGLAFGPGDPEYRYPYMGGGDEANFYRLDLEKQNWIKLIPTADKKRLHFGDASGQVQAWDAGGGIPWANDGTDNMYPGYRGWTKLYERVK